MPEFNQRSRGTLVRQKCPQINGLGTGGKEANVLNGMPCPLGDGDDGVGPSGLVRKPQQHAVALRVPPGVALPRGTLPKLPQQFEILDRKPLVR